MKTYTVRVSIPGVAPFHFTAIGRHVIDVLVTAINLFGLEAKVSARAA